MKNKTTYSKIVSLKKKFFKKQIISPNIAWLLDNFFNSFHNSVIQLKDRSFNKIIHTRVLSKDRLVQYKDLTKDRLVQYKDLTKDFLIQKKDLAIDKVSLSQNTGRENVDVFFEKNSQLKDTANIFRLVVEIIKIILFTLYYAKWSVSEKTDQDAVRNIRRIIVNSKNVRNRVMQYYNKNSFVIYPPIDTRRMTFSKNGNYWLSVNRLTPEKRCELQIEAFRQMTDKKLVIIGGFEEKNTYIQSLFDNKPENVSFIGGVTESALRDYYANCKGFITTAKNEDFGMTVIEAMASGKAVIAPNEGGYKETVINGVTGSLLDEVNVEGIIDAVKKIENNLVLDTEHYLKKNTTHAQEFSTNNFSTKINKFLQNSIYYEKDKQIIFIIGVPRSGTTWLWGLISSHPNVATVTKSDFDNTSTEIETNMLFDKSFIEISNVFRSKNAKFILEKTPDHLMKIERIKNEFPNAKIVHIIRNPFSIYSSYKNSDWNKKNISVEVWLKLYIDRISFFIQHRKYKNLYTLRYEDLNSHPEKTLSKLFNFLKLDKTPLSEIIRENNLVSKSTAPHGIRKAENNSWVTELAKSEKEFIYEYTKNLYPVANLVKIPKIEIIKLRLNDFFKKRELKNKKIIFIVGMPRSGTTWLWNILSENPLTHTLTANDLRFFKKSRFFLREESNAFFDFSIRRIKKVFNHISKDIIIEKTPMHVVKIKEISQYFPNAKIINIVRNPISVYASYKLTHNEKWAYRHIEVEKWVELYKNTFNKFKDYLESENVLTVSYEHLLKDTNEELKKINNFLEIEDSYLELAIINNKFEKAFPIIYKERGINSLSNRLPDTERKYIEDNLKDEISILKKYYE